MTQQMPAPTPATVLADATRALDGERPAVARALLAPLVAAHPGAAQAWLQLARAESALGAVDAARTAFDTCLRHAPKEPVVWLERALFEATQARGGRVVAAARKAGLPAPLLAMVQGAAGGRGVQAMGQGAAGKADMAALSRARDAGDLRAVEARATPLLRTRAGAAVWALLGQARQAAGRLEAAAEAFRQGIRLEPYAVDLRLGLARALAGRGDLAAALVEARRAAQLAPLLPAAQLIHGRIALQAGLADRALALAEDLLSRQPTLDAARVLAAEAALEAGQPAAGLTHAQARAITAPGRDVLLAHAMTESGDMDGADAVLSAALTRDKGDVTALLARGQLRQSLGRPEAAEADLRACLDLDPTGGMAARALAYGSGLAADDPAIAAMHAALARSDLRDADRRRFDFALARALQRHAPAQAAAHLAAANAATLRAYPYDPAQARARLDRSTRADWPVLRDAEGQSGCDAAPIFVTGLPRSGTTLVETILAAHPDVAAGGELAVLRRALEPAMTRLRDGAAADGALLTETGAAYAGAAAARFGRDLGGRRLTDKSIYSFLSIGQIRRILPRAHIVVVTRDPRDVGLSIWRNHFRDGTHRYAASQEGIADQVALFHAALDFWEAALPGAVHRIAYEDLLDAPEAQSRALLAAVDLPWDDRVLSFHDHADQVRTLSFAQVRQPLYRSSKGGWRKSADEIAPLIEALAARGLLPD